MPKKTTYEEALTRLQQIVSELEKGDTPLEDSISLFEEGARLASTCYTMLSNAEQKIAEFTQEVEGVGEDDEP